MARYPLLLLAANLLFLASVTAWQFPGPAPNNRSPQELSRRAFLVQVPAATTVLVSSAPPPAVAISSSAAKEQWTKSLSTIDNLLDNWATMTSGGGDAIRVQLGTQGTTSPLFQIDKALKVLREDADDLVEFTEQSEEFQLTLSRADSMAYSANFAGGSGKPTPPAVYIEKAKKEVESLQKIAKSLGSLI